MSKKMQKQIRTIDYKKQFSEIIHELRSPLSSLMGSIIFIKKYIEKNENQLHKNSEELLDQDNSVVLLNKAKRSVDIIEKSNKRMMQLIDYLIKTKNNKR